MKVRAWLRGMAAVFLCLLTVGCSRLAVSVSLDQPIPPKDLPSGSPTPFGAGTKFYTLEERISVVKRILPSVILPEGLPEFVTEIDGKRNPRNQADDLFLTEDSYFTGNGPLTYRSFLVDSCMKMGMNFMYDTKREVVVTDFAWHVDDPRSPKELLQVLTTTTPLEKEESIGTVDKMRFPDPDVFDPWRRALNALTSKPDNYARAWKLRFLEDTRSSVMLPMSGQILWSGTLSNAQGEPVFMVIKYHPALATKGPTACFACYVFEADGRFKGGLLMSDTYEDYRPLHVEPDAAKGTVELVRNTEIKGTFVAEPHGVEFNPAPTFSGDMMGKVLYRAE